jgi:hypothetical protein
VAIAPPLGAWPAGWPTPGENDMFSSLCASDRGGFRFVDDEILAVCDVPLRIEDILGWITGVVVVFAFHRVLRPDKVKRRTANSFRACPMRGCAVNEGIGHLTSRAA